MSIRVLILTALLALVPDGSSADVAPNMADFTAAQSARLLAHAGSGAVEATGITYGGQGEPVAYRGVVYFEPSRSASGICRSRSSTYAASAEEGSDPIWNGAGERRGESAWLSHGRRCGGKPSAGVSISSPMDDQTLREILRRGEELGQQGSEWLRRQRTQEASRIIEPPFRLAWISISPDFTVDDGDYRILCTYEGRGGSPLVVALERRGNQLAVHSAGVGPTP